MTTQAVCEQLAQELQARGWMLASAESCTGGLIAAACTDLSGSSTWFERGFVTYSNEAALEPAAGAAEVRAGGGDHAAGAAFRRRQHPAAGLQLLRELLAQRTRVHASVLHSAITSSVQKAASRSSARMPKPPRQP